MEGAFLGLEGPPFPGCPAGGRVFWGCLGKGRLRLAPTGRSACLSLCPRPLLTFWKTTLKKGLPAHSAWDPRVLGGEEPPEGVQYPWGEQRLSAQTSLAQGLGPRPVAAERELDPKKAAQGSPETRSQVLCQPPNTPIPHTAQQ